MNGSRNRADDRLETWRRATALPVPSFTPPRPRHRPRAAVLIAIGAILVATLVAGLVVGGYLARPRGPFPPGQIPATVARAIAAAPGIEYTLAITSRQGAVALGLHSTGRIDFQHGRFSGTADRGAGQFMLLFGGPQSGAAVVADGLFIQTEGGPWERIPDPKSPLDLLVDPVRLSTTVEHWLTASRIDPAVRTAPCGTETCQVVMVTVSPQALFDLAGDLMDRVDHGTPPPDLGPIDVDLTIDPSGFPVRMETHVTAGPTTTDVTLDLVRMDPAPSIGPPIP